MYVLKDTSWRIYSDNKNQHKLPFGKFVHWINLYADLFNFFEQIGESKSGKLIHQYIQTTKQSYMTYWKSSSVKLVFQKMIPQSKYNLFVKASNIIRCSVVALQKIFAKFMNYYLLILKGLKTIVFVGMRKMKH